LPHILKILPGKALAEFFSQIPGKPFNQLGAITGPLLAGLFKLDDSSAKFPVGGNQDSIDRPGCLLSGCRQQR
jgi:hypothetical protein